MIQRTPDLELRQRDNW